MVDTRGAVVLFLIFAAIAFVFLVAISPGAQTGADLAVLPVDRPNRHIEEWHPEACKFFEPEERDGWVVYFSKSLGQWLFCKPDPYEVRKNQPVRGVFIGAEFIAGVGFVFFVITAFWARARYWRRVINRDGYER